MDLSLIHGSVQSLVSWPSPIAQVSPPLKASLVLSMPLQICEGWLLALASHSYAPWSLILF